MVRARCAVKGELSEGADRLAVAVRGRRVGGLRKVIANSQEGSGGAARKELPGEAGNLNRKSWCPGGEMLFEA